MLCQGTTILTLALGVAVTASTQRLPSEVLASDDECRSEMPGSSCSLNLLQRRADRISSVERADRVARELSEASSDERHGIVKDAEGARRENQNVSSSSAVVWVIGYARSGSSTLHSMVNAAGGHAGPDSPRVWSLYEPCHTGDELEPQLAAKGCAGLLSQVARCDFTGVETFYGWGNSHTTFRQGLGFSPAEDGKACASSQLVTFKTITWAHDLQRQAVPLLDGDERLRVLDVVRDPRGIYASWKTTAPFDWMLANQNTTLMADLCRNLAANVDVLHPRIRHVPFERVVSDPTSVMKGVFKFLGLPFGEAQAGWIESTFNTQGCSQSPDATSYQDCHSNSSASLEKWRDVLNSTEIESFRQDPHCRKVAQAYGYPY